MTEKLKSCPFCGHNARVFQSLEGYLIQCNYCCNRTIRYRKLDCAIEAWNRRAPLYQAAHEMYEILRHLLKWLKWRKAYDLDPDTEDEIRELIERVDGKETSHVSN